MAPEEEEEALSTLKTMPSAETIVSAAEIIDTCLPSQTPLFVQVKNVIIIIKIKIFIIYLTCNLYNYHKGQSLNLVYINRTKFI